ncbi:MAG: NAD-dependent epimerase/dehydratase family protein [Acidiferrobacter sp.]
MKILITGGAGFIGSHVADRLVRDGHSVRILDNLSTGRLENLAGMARGAHLVLGDVRDPARVMMASEGVDGIIHLAAVASVQSSMEDPIGTHATNMGGTLNCLRAAAMRPTRRFLYASSAAVYGDQCVPPVAESASLSPLSPYAIDKLAGEYFCDYYRRQHGLNSTAFRFFNVYGPRQDARSPYSGVISRFAESLRLGRPFTVYGDGCQTRDFVYIDDLVDILVDAVIRTDLSGLVLNVGTGVEQDINTLIGILEDLNGMNAQRIYAPPRAGDIRRSRAATERLRASLGIVPHTPLPQGLRQFLGPLAAVPYGLVKGQ